APRPRRTLHAAALLEKEPSLAGKLRFATGELLFRINDRLAAPKNEATLAAARPALGGRGGGLFGGRVELARLGGPKDLFAVRLTGPTGTSLATLLERAGGPPAADASLVT